jgi:transcriptional regulator with XRE-family HTH domain
MDYQSAQTFADLLGMIKSSRRRGSSEFSYQQLAQKLAFKSPRSIAMVRKGQRPPSNEMVKSLCEYLNASSLEKEFIQLLAEKSKRIYKGLETDVVNEKLQRYRLLRATPPAGVKIPGVLIEVAPDAPELIRKRIHEIMSELNLEFGES